MVELEGPALQEVAHPSLQKEIVDLCCTVGCCLCFEAALNAPATYVLSLFVTVTFVTMVASLSHCFCSFCSFCLLVLFHIADDEANKKRKGKYG
jgi:hypothetical protein